MYECGIDVYCVIKSIGSHINSNSIIRPCTVIYNINVTASNDTFFTDCSFKCVKSKLGAVIVSLYIHFGDVRYLIYSNSVVLFDKGINNSKFINWFFSACCSIGIFCSYIASGICCSIGNLVISRR